MIKACLFDLHYILTQPSRDRGVSVDDMGEVIRNDSVDVLAGKGVGGLTGVGTPQSGRDRLRENAKDYFEYGSMRSADRILPGALDLIKNLRKNGIKLASTATDCRPESVLSSVGLFSMFDYVIDPSEVAERPDPEVLLKAANHLGVDPKDCVAFENTPEGIEAAKAAGMRCIAVGDLTKLYKANMGVPTVKGLTLLKMKDGLEYVSC